MSALIGNNLAQTIEITIDAAAFNLIASGIFYIAFISLKYAIYGVTKPSVWCNQSFGLFKTNALFGINQPSVPFKGTETGFLESRIRAGLSFFSVGL